MKRAQKATQENGMVQPVPMKTLGDINNQKPQSGEKSAESA